MKKEWENTEEKGKKVGKFYYWGPLLFKTKLEKGDLEALKKLATETKLKKIDARKKLVGVIQKEFTVDLTKYTKIIQPYLEAYREVFLTWYGEKPLEVKPLDVWLNLMKKGECNPPHGHTKCDLSSNLYLEVPAELKKENEKFKGKGSGPGSITFMVSGPQSFYNNDYSFLPEVGDLYIFPWNLLHFVGSFNSKGIRSSIAANYKIINAKK